MGSPKLGRINEQLMVRDTPVRRAMRAATGSSLNPVFRRGLAVAQAGFWRRLPVTNVITSGLHDRGHYIGEAPWHG